MPKNLDISSFADRVISTKEAAVLTGFAASTIIYKVKNSGFPQPVLSGKSYQYNLAEVLSWLQAENLPIKVNPETLGRKKIVVPEGDRLIGIQELMRLLGLKRSWLQEAISRGIIPEPIQRKQPLPSLWLYSDIERWLNQPDPSFYFKKLDNTYYEVYVGEGNPKQERLIGKVERVTQKRVTRSGNSPTYKDVVSWKPVGFKAGTYKARIDAARWLYRMHNNTCLYSNG